MFRRIFSLVLCSSLHCMSLTLGPCTRTADEMLCFMLFYSSALPVDGARAGVKIGGDPAESQIQHLLFEIH